MNNHCMVTLNFESKVALGLNSESYFIMTRLTPTANKDTKRETAATTLDHWSNKGQK